MATRPPGLALLKSGPGPEAAADGQETAPGSGTRRTEAHPAGGHPAGGPTASRAAELVTVDGSSAPAGPAFNPSAFPTAAPAPVARVRNASRGFDSRRVLRGLDLDIAPGEFIALLGRSGSGKTTLLRALAGLDPDVTGVLSVQGTVAVAFQEPRLLPWKRVLANVALGLRPGPGTKAETLAANALQEVGLTERAQAWPLTLSGGEAQRASLARALVREPDLLLLDEPFCALDALTRGSMHDLVLNLWARHRPAVLMVTHDVDEALALADRALVLRDGRISCEFAVNVDRPRDRNHPQLVALRDNLLAELGVNPKGTL